MYGNDQKSVWRSFPDLVDKLRECIEKGFSGGRAAAELGHGINRNMAIGKANRMGLTFKSIPSVRKKRDRRQNANGTSVQHIKLRKTGEFFVEQPVRDVIELEIPQEQRKSILELSNAVCRYPIGEPGSGDFFFCGGDTNDNPPYCTFHSRVCFASPVARASVPYKNWANK